MDFRFDIIVEYAPFLLSGLLMTFYLSIAGIFFGTIIGLFIGLGKMAKSRAVSFPFSVYVGFIQGTPLYVQILIIHFMVIPEENAVIAAIAALSLNAAAYIAEICRAGVQSIERGQMEAARSLGLNHVQAMRFVILPQAIKRVLPPLGNEFVSLIKNSSLAATIATPEVTYWAQAMGAEYYKVWEPYITLTAIYLVLTFSISYLVNRLERRLSTHY